MHARSTEEDINASAQWQIQLVLNGKADAAQRIPSELPPTFVFLIADTMQFETLLSPSFFHNLTEKEKEKEHFCSAFTYLQSWTSMEEDLSNFASIEDLSMLRKWTIKDMKSYGIGFSRQV